MLIDECVLIARQTFTSVLTLTNLTRCSEKYKVAQNKVMRHFILSPAGYTTSQKHEKIYSSSIIVSLISIKSSVKHARR